MRSGKPGYVPEQSPLLWHFHDARSGTFSHLVACAKTRRAVLIDPVLGFEPGPARTNTRAAEHIASLIRAEALTLEWVLETHIHADHLSSAQFFKRHCGARVGIGARAREVQLLYAPLFAFSHDFTDMRSPFDRLWQEDEHFNLGSLEVRVLDTGPHTGRSDVLRRSPRVCGRHGFSRRLRYGAHGPHRG